MDKQFSTYKSIWIIMLFFIGYLFYPSLTIAQTEHTYYVSPTGNDHSPGTVEQPFGTIHKGVSMLEPGDILILRGGTYYEKTLEVYDMNGSPAAPYTIENYPGETPVLYGSKSVGEGITFNDGSHSSSYWQIKGLTFTGFTGAAIYIKKGSNHFDLENLTIYGLDGPEGSVAGTEGIMGEGSQYVTVQNCNIFNIGLRDNKPKDHGIYIGYGANKWTINSNRIHDNSGSGIHLYGAPDGGSYSQITNNVLYNNHNWGLVMFDVTGSSVLNNRFYNNGDCDIYFQENAGHNIISGNYFGSSQGNYNVAIGDQASTINTFDSNIYTKPVNTVFYLTESFDFQAWQGKRQEAHGTFTATPLVPSGKIYTTDRLSGENRFATAKAIAESFAPGQVDHVIITSGYNYPDALGGSVLAQQLKAPILLGGPLPQDAPETLEYVQKHLKPSGTIYILGGKAAVTDVPYTALGNQVIRLGGETRYDTNELIDDQIGVSQGTPVVVASGNGFADGLSISGVAALKGYPIVLTDLNTLPEQAKAILAKVRPSLVYLIGGQGVISEEVSSQIAVVTGLSPDKIVRIGGRDRYETSLEIAKQFNLDSQTATIASGEDFPDALTGGVLASKLHAPVILLDKSGERQKEFFDANNYNNFVILGGPGALSPLVTWRLAN